MATTDPRFLNDDPEGTGESAEAERNGTTDIGGGIEEETRETRGGGPRALRIRPWTMDVMGVPGVPLARVEG